MSEEVVLEFTTPDELVLTPAATQEEIDLIFAPIINAGQANRRFTWDQTIASQTWTIPHNLNAYPSVTVVDSAGARVEADVRYIDADIVQVSFGQANIGKAFLN